MTQKKVQKLPGSPLKPSAGIPRPSKKPAAAPIAVTPFKGGPKHATGGPVAVGTPIIWSKAYGGLADEVEECERVAAHSSPIKATTRTTKQTMVSITISDDEDHGGVKNVNDSDVEIVPSKVEVVPVVKPTKSTAVATRPKLKPKSKMRVKQEPGEVKMEFDDDVDFDVLPKHVMESEEWQAALPTYRMWVGSLENPFCVPSIDGLELLQALYDFMFPLDQYPQEAIASNKDSPIFKRMNKRMNEYRNGMATSAEDALQAFFIKKGNEHKYAGMDARVEYAAKQLVNNAFAYEKAEGVDQKLWTGTLRGRLIIDTLAYHVGSIRGALSLPCGKKPIGAVALAAAAVKRILWLYSERRLSFATDERGAQTVVIASTFQSIHQKATGKMTKSDSYFSDKFWGPSVRLFANTAKALPEKKLTRIIVAAEAASSNTSNSPGGSQSSSSVSEASGSVSAPILLYISLSDQEDA
ncbi:hypothetical protein OBBRIDRAFT_840303 [Obba rivulosa]|uniref:Uncharacterized protein n=1 Tax=Obba rivulosa TaxID=1052685 RepID=A0A8E2AHS7_9APHY|nr:hypothetical protein OBBRIDRAFT_840303 [Obba rivulosa]